MGREDTETKLEREKETKRIEMKVQFKRVCGRVVVCEDECLPSHATLIGHYLR